MMDRKKVVVALSGGVDSSVAALLALRAGYEVIGVTLDLVPPEAEWKTAWSCGGDAEALLKEITERLGIEHHRLAVYPEFEARVLKRCFEEYAVGRTPNPCAFCNPAVKFGLIADFAAKIRAEKVITGHYAGLTQDHLIRRGTDRGKDQSYFLALLPCNLLQMLEFPLAGMMKSDVRNLAQSAGLPCAVRPDSQDACFHFPQESFAQTLFRRFHGTPTTGCFLYQGKVVGRHPGIHRFTLGQRKGMQVALGLPGYVRKIEQDGDIELVTDQKKLEAVRFQVINLNWQSETPPACGEDLNIQIRYRTPAGIGRIEIASHDGVTVKMDEPLRAVTPGQIAAFYRDDVLLGGGIIQAVELMEE